MNSPQNQQQKTGRNAPCCCGSGKKYKHCCLQSNNAVPIKQISLSQQLQLAISHHQAGRLPQAEDAYRQILSIIPEHPDGLHLSGVIAFQKGELDSAVELIDKAISANPEVADYYNNLGLALRAQGKPNAAIASYQQALLIRPDYAEAHNNLGVIFRGQGKPDAAIECYRKALAIMPYYVDAHINIGMTLRDLGRLDSASEHLHKAICTKPDSAEAYSNLGGVFRLRGKPDAAIECYRRTLAIMPNHLNAHINIGMALRDIDRLDSAIEHLRKAVYIKPESAQAHNNLGILLMEQGELDASVKCYQKAISIKPDYAEAYNVLGSALMEQGQQQQAIAAYEKGLAFDPCYFPLHHSLIFSASRMCSDDAKVFELSRQFGKQAEEGLSRLSHSNNTISDRRLKIGYISGDFRQHSVAYFIRPILANHDKQNVEIFCYYNHYRIDRITRQLMGYANHWRSIFGVSDEDAAELIRQDAIDILVDLSGHTSHNRLLLFAQKPAPVQVTWIGYPSTTGLSAMDYRLTSIHRDPIGWNEQYHTESLVRLSTPVCFEPEEALPEINALPALKNDYLTFASFHVPNKITAITISLWAKVLYALPTAKLVLAPDTAKDQIIRQFQVLGISADRLSFFCHQPLPQYLALHNEIDIMLDTFPYNGSTVSRHSLWMGIPILTLAGRKAVSRVGLALMAQLGLETFAAESEEVFVENARRWANDLDGLAQVRNTLREKMQNAPFSKPALVVNELEAAYRQMWRAWCGM
ncbi:MAG TPA: tetratricopeptide repeat protein [Methylobacter sp.]